MPDSPVDSDRSIADVYTEAMDEVRRLEAENDRLQGKVDAALGYIRDSGKDHGERLNLAELALEPSGESDEDLAP